MHRHLSLGLAVLVFGFLGLLGCVEEEQPLRTGPLTKDNGIKKTEGAGSIFNRKFSKTDFIVESFYTGLDGKYYLISSAGGLWRSSDALDWSPIDLPQDEAFSHPSAVAVDQNGTIYLGSNDNSGGVYISEDNGGSYTRIKLSNSFVGVKIDRLVNGGSGEVYAANVSEFYTLKDLGAVVEKNNWPPGFPSNNAMLFSAHKQLFTRYNGGSTTSRIAGSTDMGKSFTERKSSVSPFVMAQNSKGLLFAIDREGVLAVSEDNGKNFKTISTLKSEKSLVDFAIGPNDWLYALSPDQLFYSTDDGKSFKKIRENLNLKSASLEQMMINKNDQVIVSSQDGVYFSE